MPEEYSHLTIVVGKTGTKKHPDDGPGEWYNATLVYGPGDTDHIKTSSGSPKAAVDFAIDMWDRKGRP